jgi:acylphosphatase
MNVSYIAHISGKVQGVYFRVSSQQKAIDFGLSGYAKNLSDGDVEVFLSGKQENVDKMLSWLKHGPEQAQVTQMKQKKVDWQAHSFFSIG